MYYLAVSVGQDPVLGSQKVVMKLSDGAGTHLRVGSSSKLPGWQNLVSYS